jgi:hypothetical protein
MSGSNSSAPAGGVPSEPLSFTVHSMPRLDVGDDARRTRSGRWKMMLVLLACAAPVIASYITYFVIRPQGRTNYAELILPIRPMPVLLLTDLDGRGVTGTSLTGQWLIVTVAGAACDSACEKRLYLQRQLREMLGRDRDRVDRVWLVTDDGPLRPELLAALGSDPAAHVLRVPHTALAKWLDPAAGESLDSHLYIVDPMGNWMMRAPVNPDPTKLRRDLDRLLRASASWDHAGR